MFTPPNFAAHSALHKISKIMARIFQLQEKLKIENTVEIPKSNQKINKTLKNIYLMNLEDETIILAFYFVDQITKKLRIFLNLENSTGILIGAIIIADKILNDYPRNIDKYQLASGLKKQQLIEIEIQFLEILDYNLYVTEENFEKYQKRVQEY
ncbi:unnamed protein product (macronuclear) [Paramecium tetraurelia]|uniref:Cyclin N-terminal domain-containing protein n=1 Tax=Paramecium tetraurelia TaxID=5888 RepID=A0D5X4_PARTE|nr:uncharacterized protein GSPATT00013871001 [Paramecium tetraurelia]CAK78441.1 unnamed protein product [Paramecium tetraurelia]|eukprot:XP_001445838.1 hypothetical protein (macronuclear) [Paramecium tetraurelia strain d4-2]